MRLQKRSAPRTEKDGGGGFSPILLYVLSFADSVKGFKTNLSNH